MGMFTLTADLDKLDGNPSSGQFVVTTNTRLGGKVWDRSQSFTATNGVLTAELPANDVEPYQFGFTVRRVSGGETWLVPTQVPGAKVDLAGFAVTSPLPVPPSIEQRLAELEQNGAGNPTPMTYYGPADQPPGYVGWSFWIVTASATDPTPVDVRTP